MLMLPQQHQAQSHLICLFYDALFICKGKNTNINAYCFGP